MECSICYEVKEKCGDISCPCPEESHGAICNDCSSSYSKSKIFDAFMGSCPVLYCPGIHSSKATILKFTEWTALMKSKEVGLVAAVDRYNELASSLLSFLCSNCHKMNSLFVPAASDPTAVMKELTERAGYIGSTPEQFSECLAAYGRGFLSSTDAFTVLTSELFRAADLDDTESWAQFEKILSVIDNPERRANLHLRYIRSRPRCWTRCCKREHCFKCKTKDFHNGKTCDEVAGQLSNDMIECPACSIYLVKGDGCNSVTCVCGNQFSWSSELQISKASRLFLETNPSNPCEACANILCNASSSTEHVTNANAWRSRNTNATNKELLRWWSRNYGAGAPQACALKKPLEFASLPTGRVSYKIENLVNKLKTRRLTNGTVASISAGAETASNLYAQANEEKVRTSRQQIDDSIESLFLTMYPKEAERGAAAVKVLNKPSAAFLDSLDENSKESMMILSAYRWATKNEAAYAAAMEESESQLARCFLCLYGSKQVPRPDFDNKEHLKAGIVGVAEWNKAASNSSLEFPDAATVKRPGGASCYPAAFATIPTTKSVFMVRILEAGQMQNTLSFGVARRQMAKESSDGVGRTPNTWGIYDERGSSSDVAKFCANGSTITYPTRMRKFAVGDVLRCSVDLSAGTCEVSLNEEYTHVFTIPVGTVEDYYFAMTFANDHKVTIIADNGPAAIEKLSCIENVEHLAMLRALLVRLKKISDSVASIDPARVERIQDLADKFPQSVGCKNERDSLLEVLNLEALISWVTCSKPATMTEKRRQMIDKYLYILKYAPTTSSSLTWQQLVYGVCYMAINKDQLQDIKKLAKKSVHKDKKEQARLDDELKGTATDSRERRSHSADREKHCRKSTSKRRSSVSSIGEKLSSASVCDAVTETTRAASSSPRTRTRVSSGGRLVSSPAIDIVSSTHTDLSRRPPWRI